MPQRTLTSKSITPVKAGEYTVRVILSGCYSDVSDAVTFTPTSTAEQINAVAGLKLYPNPTKDEFTLESTEFVKGAYLVEMFDVIGKSIFSKSFNFIDSKALKVTYNTNGLPTGVYFIKVSSDGKTRVLKLIVE